jgi:hypothetical protein
VVPCLCGRNGRIPGGLAADPLAKQGLLWDLVVGSILTYTSEIYGSQSQVQDYILQAMQGLGYK